MRFKTLPVFTHYLLFKPLPQFWVFISAQLPLLSESENVSYSVVSSSLWPHGASRLLCLWDSPGKNNGVGCHSHFQGIFPTQGLNSGLPHCRQMLHSQKWKRPFKCSLAYWDGNCFACKNISLLDAIPLQIKCHSYSKGIREDTVIHTNILSAWALGPSRTLQRALNKLWATLRDIRGQAF